MKRLYFVLILLLSTCTGSSSLINQKQDNKQLNCPIEYSQSYSIVNGKEVVTISSGEETVLLQFDYIHPFQEGLAAVLIDGYWGFIDKNGKIVIQPEFEHVRDFVEGLASFSVGAVLELEDEGKFGFIDQTGKIVVEPKFDQVTDLRRVWLRLNWTKSTAL